MKYPNVCTAKVGRFFTDLLTLLTAIGKMNKLDFFYQPNGKFGFEIW